MAHPNLDVKEQVAVLPGTSLTIWKVHPDTLREQDKNARIMDPQVFQRLTENIKSNSQLESLPYCHRTVSPGGSEEFAIISGHHRVRAARKAGLTTIYILVEEKDLTRSQIIAKQLAHNALAGEDDPQALVELYKAIDDINAKIESGLVGLEEKIEDLNVQVDEIKFKFDYEQVELLFLKTEYDDFTKVLDELTGLQDSRDILICNYEQFEKYKSMIQEVSKKENVRNIAAIMTRIFAIISESLKDQKGKKNKV